MNYDECRIRPTPGHTSVGRVGQYTYLVGYVLVPVGRGRLTWIPRSRHSYRARQDQNFRVSECRPPRALTLLEEDWLIAWRLIRFFYGNADGSRGILVLFSASGQRLRTWTHLK